MTLVQRFSRPGPGTMAPAPATCVAQMRTAGPALGLPDLAAAGGVPLVTAMLVGEGAVCSGAGAAATPGSQHGRLLSQTFRADPPGSGPGLGCRAFAVSAGLSPWASLIGVRVHIAALQAQLLTPLVTRIGAHDAIRAAVRSFT